MKTCVTCGTKEERRRDPKGRELTNIDPVTGKCLTCLMRAVKTRLRIVPTPHADHRAKAARNDD